MFSFFQLSVQKSVPTKKLLGTLMAANFSLPIFNFASWSLQTPIRVRSSSSSHSSRSSMLSRALFLQPPMIAGL